MSLPRRAKEIYQQEGLIPLLKSSYHYSRNRMRKYKLTILSLLSGNSPMEENYKGLSENKIREYGHTTDPENDPANELRYELIEEFADDPAKILEVGCNVGRNLEFLRRRGYSQLYGIDINPTAINMMDDVFPELSGLVKTQVGPAQQELSNYDDNSFDVIFTSAVLQHIQSNEEELFNNMANKSRDIIITFENESLEPIPREDHDKFLYNQGTKYVEIRDYEEIFTSRGYTLVDSFNSWDGSQKGEKISNLVTSGFDNCYTGRVFKKDRF